MERASGNEKYLFLSPLSCQPRSNTMQRHDSSPSPLLPLTPPQPTPTMGLTAHISEDSLLDDKEYLDVGALPFASHTKAFGRRKRTLFATATLVSLLFLGSYLAIQHRASDQFTGDLEPFPYSPEDVDVQLTPNATYPIESPYSSVRGPPTPLFRGARLLYRE